MLSVLYYLTAKTPILAQLVEHLTVDVSKSNQNVAGSIPANRKFYLICIL